MHTNVVLKHDYNERMYIVVIIHIHEPTTYIHVQKKCTIKVEVICMIMHMLMNTT